MKRTVLVLFCGIIAAYSAFVVKKDIVPALNSSMVFPSSRFCIIDAGHGGFDGGAVAFDGTLEKDLNLQMAKKLNDILILNGYQTVMIRQEDISVEEAGDTHKKKGDIRKRFKIAETYPDALFISIHQNSYKQSNSEGTQVFYGSKNPKSLLLAEAVQDAVKNGLQIKNRRTTKKAGNNLYLLSHMENVSIMVECGFISNKNELAKLKDEEYQQKLMLRVFEGIEKYYEREGMCSG